MKKVYTRLLFTCISLLTAIVMIASVSYAWLVLSKSPAVNGISVLLGGGQSILLAPDMTETVTTADGQKQTVHYPGKFSNTLDFSGYETYDYLKKVGALTPVSSADGRYWMIPEYEEDGTLKEIGDFQVDKTLSYANQEKQGGYVYLDFWMVSPGSAYDVRVSTDVKSGRGSFLAELPGVSEQGDGSLTLTDPQNIVASSARVGFLVNGDQAGTEDMEAYTKSTDYQSSYKKLLGVYQRQGETYDPLQPSSFSIYEPNATLHPAEDTENGSYVLTKPLKYLPFQEKTEETALDPSILSVQKTNVWKKNDSGKDTILNEMFQAGVAEKKDLTKETAADWFYGTYLQNQVEQYLTSGVFLPDTEALYETAEQGAVTKESVQAMQTAGASDGAVITRLERNTPQRVRMYIWLEGQDADCRSDTMAVKGSAIVVKLELAGATG